MIPPPLPKGTSTRSAFSPPFNLDIKQIVILLLLFWVGWVFFSPLFFLHLLVSPEKTRWKIMTGLHNQYQNSSIHLAWVYAVSPARAYEVLLSTVATCEFHSVTEKLHRVTVGVLMVYALHYAFDMFFNVGFFFSMLFYNFKRKGKKKEKPLLMLI